MAHVEKYGKDLGMRFQISYPGTNEIDDTDGKKTLFLGPRDIVNGLRILITQWDELKADFNYGDLELPLEELRKAKFRKGKNDDRVLVPFSQFTKGWSIRHRADGTSISIPLSDFFIGIIMELERGNELPNMIDWEDLEDGPAHDPLKQFTAAFKKVTGKSIEKECATQYSL